MNRGVCKNIKSRTTSGFWCDSHRKDHKGFPLFRLLLFHLLSFFLHKHRGKHRRSKACDFNRVLFIYKGCNEIEALRRTGLKFLPLALGLAPKSQSCYLFRNSWDLGEGKHLLSECCGSGTTEPCT